MYSIPFSYAIIVLWSLYKEKINFALIDMKSSPLKAYATSILSELRDGGEWSTEAEPHIFQFNLCMRPTQHDRILAHVD